MEVIVQDANNIVIEVDQGRQGRGVEDVSLITVGADYYLLFTFTDGTTEQVGPIATTVTEVISAEVRNAEAVTILKGQPVYLYQAQGNLATVKLAYNTSDATSAKTLGLAAENIAPGAQGLITCQGTLGGLNTSAYSEGDTLYLGATAGTLTSVKPQAPNHLVYVGVVERANAGAGQIYVRVQNGFELDEIHDVRIVSPVNGNTLIYDASTSLWKNAGITAGSGVSVTNGPASITVGNTGVLSLSGGTTGLTPATATTGAVTLAGTLGIANGGTGQTTANAALNALLPAQTFQSGKYLKTDGSNAAWDQLDISTADITGTLPIANGGTGQSTANAGLNALLPSQTSQSGKYLKTDGTNASWDQLDISTADITGTLPVANGGTGVTTSTGTGSVVLSNSPALTTPNLGTPSAVTLTNATGLPLSTGVTGTLATTNGGTGLTSFTANGVVYASSSSSLATGSALTFDGTNFANTVGSMSMALGSNLTWGGVYGANIPTIAGTSNGLQFYPQGSTSGEQMRLTSTGLGIGTSSPGAKLHVAGSILFPFGANGIFSDSTSRKPVIFTSYDAGSNTDYLQVGSPAVSAGVGTDIRFNTGTFAGWGEKMRLDSSGNLGIGTSSPSTAFQVVRNYTGGVADSLPNIITSNTAPSASPYALAIVGAYTLNETLKVELIADGSGIITNSAGGGLFTRTNHPLVFGTNTTERARIDTAGNLGLGVTPSAWGSARIAIDVGSRVAFGAESGYPLIAENAYNSGGGTWNYKTTGYAGLYEQRDSSHQWYTAPSGTAGNTISFTQAMTLDASGNLGVGTTSPTAIGSYNSITVNGTSGSLFDLFVGGTIYGRIRGTANEMAVLSQGASSVLTLGTNNTERARIDTAGNLGLGVTPSAWNTNSRALQVGGNGYVVLENFNGINLLLTSNTYRNSGGSNIYLTSAAAASYVQASGAHQWYTAPSGTAGNAISFTQAMTLTAAGRLGVGVTAPNYTFETAFDAAVTAGGCTALLSAEGGAQGSVGTTTNHALLLKTNNTERARITSTGNVVAGGSVALATTATDGFLYVPTCAGTPTGTPTAITGMAPIVVDTTNNKMYFYSGGAWRDAGP